MAITSTVVLVQIVGSVALMLWGIRLVRTGFIRAFGGSLRHYLGLAISGRFTSFWVGLAITVFLQSSTATALIISSFASKGLVQTPAALAVMLGADVGTSISAQILSFNLSWLAYAAILIGFFLHGRGGRFATRQIGRAIVGLGMVLLALSLIRMSSQPLREADGLAYVLSALEGEALLTLFLMAVLTWLVHSSLAVVLLTASLASAGIVPAGTGLIMILGANIGGTIPPIIATLSTGPQSQHAALGNAGFKLLASLLVLPFLPWVSDQLQSFGGAAQALVNFHMAFNLLVATLFLPWVQTAASLLARVFPDPGVGAAEPVTKYLDKELISSPVLALTSATRELYRVNERIEDSLALLSVGIAARDQVDVQGAQENQTRVAKMLEEFKFYLTDITREEISEGDSAKAMNLLLIATNLGHVSELVTNAVELTASTSQEQIRFSDAGAAELLEMLEMIHQGIRLALSAALLGDAKVRKTLQKGRKELERMVDESRQAHFSRLAEGTLSSISTTSLHNELLRDFSRIYYHIYTASKIGGRDSSVMMH